MRVGLLPQSVVNPHQDTAYPALESAYILITAIETLTGVITMQSLKVMKAFRSRAWCDAVECTMHVLAGS